MNTIKIMICFTVLFCLGIPEKLWSDNSQEMLVGHHAKQKELVKTVKAIFVGRFISLGDGPDADSPGMGYYDNAQVRTQQSLKGSLVGTITVSYSVQRVIEKENVPQIATDYVFFIKIISPTQLSVVKLLPATDQNVAKIKELIPIEPATK